MNKFNGVISIILCILILFTGCRTTVKEPSKKEPSNIKNSEKNNVIAKEEKVTWELAAVILNQLITENKVKVSGANTELDYVEKNDKNFHVFDIVLVDPTTKEVTKTTSRIWISAENGEAFSENLDNGKLTKIEYKLKPLE